MIFYFSSTGNCKYVAQRIASSTDDKIYSITDCMNKNEYSFELSRGENLGFVVPTYCWALPSIVEDFLSKAHFQFKEKPYVFYVGTYGTIVGNPQHYVNKYLSPMKCEIDAMYDVKMPDNWTAFFDLSDKAKVKRTNKKAELLIDSAIEKIRNHEHGNFMKNRAPLFIVAMVHNVSYDSMRKTKHFNVENSCIGCGLCAKKCPVNAIKMEYGKPVWTKDRCVMCLGCLHRCPKFSIQYDNKTKNHGQYQNPNTKI